MPLPNGNVKKLRASYYLMGAMLGRFKNAVIGLPGGCHLGPRPIDQHIKGFEALGAKVTNEHGAIYLRAEELRGAKIYLDVVSVGATINIMLAAVLAKGRQRLKMQQKNQKLLMSQHYYPIWVRILKVQVRMLSALKVLKNFMGRSIQLFLTESKLVRL